MRRGWILVTSRLAVRRGSIRAVAILMAITGHLYRPGGNLFAMPPKAAPKDILFKDRYTPELIKNLVGPEFPVAFQPFLEGPTSAYYRILESVLTEKPYKIIDLDPPWQIRRPPGIRKHSTNIVFRHSASCVYS